MESYLAALKSDQMAILYWRYDSEVKTVVLTKLVKIIQITISLVVI